MSLRFGIDLGGTKIEIIALNNSGQTLLRERIATPQGNYEATVAAIAHLVLAAESRLGQTGTVGIGIPGAESLATGLIKNANSTCLIGRPLKADLSLALNRPVRLANDANCFALSEAVDGAAAGAEIVFGVILGTGVGGGVVIHQRVISGRNAIAGEWGHNPLPLPAAEDLPLPACYCGRSGCIESYLSGPAMSQDHQKHHGVTLSAHEIAQQARRGDSNCQQTLDRYAHRLGRALAGVINLLDPDVIVLGGGLSNLPDWYERLPTLVAPYVFSDTVYTEFKPAAYGDSSGVRGAAWLWQKEYSANEDN